MARHAELLASLTDPLLRVVLELHKPVIIDDDDEPVVCMGCDEGEYAETWARFPCTTYKLIAGE